MPDPLTRKGTSSRVAAISLMLGCAMSFALMIYVRGGWMKGSTIYVAWTLMPYALSGSIFVALRFFRIQPIVERSLNWLIAAVSLAGPLFYADILFVHVDAQGALALLMVPLLQSSLVLFASAAGGVWHWRISAGRHEDNGSSLASSELAGGSRPGKTLLMFKLSVAAVLAVYLLILWLQGQDAKTIATAKEVDFFIHDFCETNVRLPTSAQLRDRFPGLLPEIGWFYFTDNDNWLKVQYPVRWRNQDAIGQEQRSEFTSTVYSYVVEYRCGN